jgi:cytoskeletal protein RodZ
MKEIGEKLRRARKDKALRMVDVQARTHISTATLTAIETGKHKNMTANTLRILANCYGKEIIVTFEDK